MYGYNDDSTGLEPDVERAYAICNPSNKIEISSISKTKSGCWDSFCYCLGSKGNRDSAVKSLRRAGYHLITVRIEKRD